MMLPDASVVEKVVTVTGPRGPPTAMRSGQFFCAQEGVADQDHTTLVDLLERWKDVEPGGYSTGISDQWAGDISRAAWPSSG
jgi:hypothetical protein